MFSNNLTSMVSCISYESSGDCITISNPELIAYSWIYLLTKAEQATK